MPSLHEMVERARKYWLVVLAVLILAVLSALQTLSWFVDWAPVKAAEKGWSPFFANAAGALMKFRLPAYVFWPALTIAALWIGLSAATRIAQTAPAKLSLYFDPSDLRCVGTERKRGEYVRYVRVGIENKSWGDGKAWLKAKSYAPGPAVQIRGKPLAPQDKLGYPDGAGHVAGESITFYYVVVVRSSEYSSRTPEIEVCFAAELETVPADMVHVYLYSQDDKGVESEPLHLRIWLQDNGYSNPRTLMAVRE